MQENAKIEAPNSSYPRNVKIWMIGL